MVDVDVNMVKVECSNDEKKKGMQRKSVCVISYLAQSLSSFSTA